MEQPFTFTAKEYGDLYKENKRLKDLNQDLQQEVGYWKTETRIKEESNKKLKEIIRQLLWRFLYRNIANIEYEGEKIELGE